MYHINPKTGRVNICRADPRYGKCPFGGADEHFEDKAEARKHFEAAQLPVSSLRKRIETRTGEAGEHNLYADIDQGVRPQEGEHCDLYYFSERDADEIFEYWERPSRTTEVNYTPSDAIAINYYQMSGHKAIGETLRQNTSSDRRTVDYIVALNKALHKAKLHSPITLFRGINGEYAKKLASLKPGAIVEESSFSSTTPSEKGALSFAKEDGVIVQIEAPAGMPALDLGAGIFTIDEDEILLRQGTFEVEAVRKEKLDGVAVTRLIVRPKLNDGSLE
jgi:hypothetical protein